MVDQARYDVLKEIGKVELRRYPRLVIARVDGYGDGGFNILFAFITGNNRQKSKIAMTAPSCFGANSHDCTSPVGS
jgi:1,4-dihydroxy-2-naphthoyl-CoA synthase